MTGSAAIYQAGYSYAKGSYQDFGDYAIFARERIADTINGGWIHDPIEKGITMASINNCSAKMKIILSNIKLTMLDTIRIQAIILSKSFPTAYLFIVDTDAIIETYYIVPDADNWLIIDRIIQDTTEIEGWFNLSFVTAYDFYLNDERERWDDPNRPDTLRFTNGKFRAVYRDF